MMNVIRCFWPLAVAVGLIYLFDNGWGSLPPMGKLFSPFHGYLQQTTSKIASSGDIELSVSGLKEAVVIQYDDNAVPHIFAQNDEDLYFAQGYIVARDRLWQMEFYALVAAGRLTEVVGADALAFDRHNRRMGMARSAAAIAEKLKADTLAGRIAEAYAAGVNAYIDQLDYKTLPIEYKLLNYRPEHWSPEKTILMLMNMRNTLNGGSNDYRLTNVLATYGPDVVADLFPDYPAVESPVIPAGTPWDFTPVAIPPIPDTTRALPRQRLIAAGIPVPRPEVGSNNWAVHGSRSATGLPLLANDPHLQLTLPSIWYQLQLATPEMNVYGVALPGTPAVIIGFNKDIAWGVTNVGSDVMDWYRIRFRDSTRREYWHDGLWKPVTLLTEPFKVKGGKTMYDTVLYTHHGPIVYEEAQETPAHVPVGYALRWVTHETGGSDMLTFHYLNRAADYDDYRKALTYFVAPAQHFIFSSNENDIAITSNGKLPLKWDGQGKYLLDGTLASHDWQGWIPAAHNPTVKNPPRGFVSSANQFPVDTTYPYYLDWKFAHSGRALRINERLAAMTSATADSLRMLQRDNFNVDARRILPTLITVLSANDSIREQPEFAVISHWNYRNDADEVGASIFEYWMDELPRALWEDGFSMDGGLLYPSRDRTFSLIKNDPEAKWFDDVRTADTIESMADIVSGSFMAAVRKLRERYGALSSDWAWATVKHTRIMHLVPAFTSFGRSDIHNGGGGEVVNATTGTHGPSWRMVVELDRVWPRAYGLYPGGQSGNPGSVYYDNMIDRWAQGELDTLLFMKDLQSEPERLRYKLSMKPNLK